MRQVTTLACPSGPVGSCVPLLTFWAVDAFGEAEELLEPRKELACTGRLTLGTRDYDRGVEP